MTETEDRLREQFQRLAVAYGRPGEPPRRVLHAVARRRRVRRVGAAVSTAVVLIAVAAAVTGLLAVTGRRPAQVPANAPAWLPAGQFVGLYPAAAELDRAPGAGGVDAVGGHRAAGAPVGDRAATGRPDQRPPLGVDH